MTLTATVPGYATTLVTPPDEEPITLGDEKLHARLDASDEDVLIESYVTAARVYAERYTGRAFITQTWNLKLDDFPAQRSDTIGWRMLGNPIFLPNPPLSSVVSITYIDDDGTTQTWASSNYDVDTDSEPGRVALAFDKTYPSTRGDIHAVTVQFIAGYGNASTVPDPLKEAIRQLVLDMYENREARTPVRMSDNPTVARLLDIYSVRGPV